MDNYKHIKITIGMNWSDVMVIKSTQFVGKTLLLTVIGELIPTSVDNTVSINGELYRVAQITDIITEEPRLTNIVREIKVVNKVYC